MESLQLNIEQLKQLKNDNILERVELVTCERDFNGVRRHINVSIKKGDEITNFNTFYDNIEAYEFIISWASEIGVEIVRRNGENFESVFNPFNNKSLPDDTVIWKYIDLSKFISLISSHSLWFARLDYNWGVDPFEGKIPKAQWEVMRNDITTTNFAPQFVGNNKYQLGGTKEDGMTQIPHADVIEGNIELQKFLHENTVYNSYITCWNVSPNESYHMWKLYCNHHNGIAVKSTIGRLKEALGENKNYSIIGGLVEYLDYNTGVPKVSNNAISHVFCKTLPYSFENEFRLCLWDTGYVNDVIDDKAPYSIDSKVIEKEINKYRPGYKVPLDLEHLIMELVVSPHSDPWFHDLINSILGEQRTFTTSLSKISAKKVTVSDMKL